MTYRSSTIIYVTRRPRASTPLGRSTASASWVTVAMGSYACLINTEWLLLCSEVSDNEHREINKGQFFLSFIYLFVITGTHYWFAPDYYYFFFLKLLNSVKYSKCSGATTCGGSLVNKYSDTCTRKIFFFSFKKDCVRKKIRRLIRLLKNKLFFYVNRGKLGVSWFCGSTDLYKYGS